MHMVEGGLLIKSLLYIRCCLWVHLEVLPALTEFLSSQDRFELDGRASPDLQRPGATALLSSTLTLVRVSVDVCVCVSCPKDIP